MISYVMLTHSLSLKVWLRHRSNMHGATERSSLSSVCPTRRLNLLTCVTNWIGGHPGDVKPVAEITGDRKIPDLGMPEDGTRWLMMRLAIAGTLEAVTPSDLNDLTISQIACKQWKNFCRFAEAEAFFAPIDPTCVTEEEKKGKILTRKDLLAHYEKLRATLG